MAGRSKNLSLQAADILCRVSFARDLMQPRKKDDPKDPDRYGCTLLIPKSVSMAPLEALALEALNEQFGADKAAQMLANGLIKTPFLDGDGKQGMNKKTMERHPGCAGNMFIRCTSSDPVPCFKVADGAIVVAGKSDIKSGDYGYPVLGAFTWNHPQNGDGVSFGIVQFLKTQDGESLGGEGGPVTDPSAYFKAPLENHGAAPAATTGGAGAGGLFGGNAGGGSASGLFPGAGGNDMG